MISKRVPGFVPSKNGFHFANDFGDVPVLSIPLPPFGHIPIGNAAGGMCGGMVFAVLDIFRMGRTPPPDTAAPQPETLLFHFLARRLIDSFNGVMGVLKYVAWMRYPDEAGSGGQKSIAWHTVNDEWPDIQADLDSGQLCPLGLIKIESSNPFKAGENHQVLAYGYDLDESSGDLQVLVYDPNCQDIDGVSLALSLADRNKPSRVSYSADPAGRGFFRTAYAPADPRSALATR
jgi:hypothetical protein